jgi:hypothetical protein
MDIISESKCITDNGNNIISTAKLRFKDCCNSRLFTKNALWIIYWVEISIAKN